MLFLYELGIRLYELVAWSLALFKPKIRLFVDGRKDWQQKLQDALLELPKAPQQLRFWLHAASLGEFEQGRPVLEGLRQHFPNCQIVLTFFSPSGYEIRKNYAQADYIAYLPLDTAENAKRFVAILQPDFVFFVKYEFWFNTLNALAAQRIPTVVFSAIFRPNQFFFKWYGRAARQTLSQLTHIFVQNSESVNLLQSIGIQNVMQAGDTRFDRVWQIKKNMAASDSQLDIIRHFKQDEPLLVLGSAWLPDVSLWAEALKIIRQKTKKSFKILIAPHELKKGAMQDMAAFFATESPLFFTDNPNPQDLAKRNILFLDTMGMLSGVYQFATVAHIGGGFGVGIHNTLEAAVWQIPLCFGPHYQKFFEAVSLIKIEVACCVMNPQDCANFWLKVLDKQIDLDDIRLKTLAFFEQQVGSTDKILNHCRQIIQN